MEGQAMRLKVGTNSCKTTIYWWDFLNLSKWWQEPEVKVLQKGHFAVFKESEMVKSHHRLSQLPCIRFHYSCTAQALESGLGRSPYTLRIHSQARLTQTRQRAWSRGGTPALPRLSAALSPSGVADLHRWEATEERILQRVMCMAYRHPDLCANGNP